MLMLLILTDNTAFRDTQGAQVKDQVKESKCVQSYRHEKLMAAKERDQRAWQLQKGTRAGNGLMAVCKP